MKHRMLLSLIALALAATVAGCATTTRTETRQQYTEVHEVRPGDNVRVTTRDGRKLDFKVTSADDKAIKGKGIEIARGDVASVQAVRTVTVKTQETSAAPAAEAISTVAIVMGVICVVAILAVF